MPTNSKKKTSFKASFTHHRDAVHARKSAYLARRPHRSFQLTRRRDYTRSLKLPGYWRFTFEVNAVMKKYWRIFAGVGLIYVALTVVLFGFGSQDAYNELTSTLRETGGEAFAGDWGQLGQAGLLFLSLATSGLTVTLTDTQQIYTAILFLMVWLTTVWLLRNLIAGHAVRLRDGLYNAGAPIISTFLVALVLLIQLLPLAIASIAFSAAQQSGLLTNGVEAMLFWFAAGLLAVLSLFWATSTFFAMIIVTLPGMYPIRALRTAGDMVTGRRVRIILRIIWMTLVALVAWALVLIPVILIDGWVKSLWPAVEWLPIVPAVLLILSAASLIWSTGYIYLLYRKVVEDDALPA